MISIVNKIIMIIILVIVVQTVVVNSVFNENRRQTFRFVPVYFVQFAHSSTSILKQRGVATARITALRGLANKIRVWEAELGVGDGHGQAGSDRAARHPGHLHGLKLVDPLLGLALADLPQGLVLVSAGTDVVLVDDVILSLPFLIAGLLQVRAQ